MSAPVLAIGIDAAEPTLVRSLIDSGRMPALAGLLAEGTWSPVGSAADIGSGAVWPTFMTGREPLQHGIHAHWAWRSSAMAPGPCDRASLRPFWRDLASRGTRVGVLDVPFAPVADATDGFEVVEWGSHDQLDGHVTASPADVGRFVAGRPPHPFTGHLPPEPSPGDRSSLDAFVELCRSGARARAALACELIRSRRPSCSLVVFSEVHHGSHYLWREQPAPGGSEIDRRAWEGLGEIYVEVDRAIGAIVEAAQGSKVLVFSLHGFRSARGVADFLAPLLIERGFAVAPDWRTQSWRGRAGSALSTLKRRSPASLKALYHRLMPAAATAVVARTTLFPAYDWKRTRAFAWPTDQHGWIRINLIGREAAGCVDPSRYDETCRELTAWLEGLTDEHGRRLVERILRTAGTVDAARASTLPDLVAHWTAAALASPLRIRGSRLTAQVDGSYLGQHAPEGFCIAKGLGGVMPPGTVRSTELSRILAAAAV